MAPLDEGGFVTAVLGATPGSPDLIVWEPRIVACDGGCWAVPYRITDDDADLDPGLGVDVGAAPTLTDGTNDTLTRPVRALLTDALWEQSFGTGAGEIVLEMPGGQPLAVGIASVTKVMTLLVTLEAVAAGEVSLADEVTVSQTAADTGGSSMNLQAGEKQSLETLLSGMMLVAGNDASVRIAEHVAAETGESFIDRMNAAAAARGMSDTTYGHPSGEPFRRVPA